MRLFVEFFATDVARTKDFYQRALGLAIEREDEDIVVLRCDEVQIHVLSVDEMPEALARDAEPGPLGTRVEFCIEVSDIHAARARAVAAGIPLAEDLCVRPWGKIDFRLIDPEGAYVRVTTGTLPEPDRQ